MRLGSLATRIRKRDVTGFPAIRAIVQAVHAEPNAFHALADGAIPVARTLILGFVALAAEHRADGHRNLLKQTLPERAALRQATHVCFA